jgi:hypothetical protein
MTKTLWAGLVGIVAAALALITLMLLAVGVREYPPVGEQARLAALEKGHAALVAERDELQRKEQHAVAAWEWAEERATQAEERANRLEGELRAAKREAAECGPPKITFPR